MTRARASDVSNVLKAMVRRDAEKAAGPNAVLSRAEQAKASAAVRAAADAVRAAKGPNARVTVDAIEAQISTQAATLIGAVNQPGPGVAYLSKVEATAAFARDPALGEAVLKAYEVASGSGVDVDGIAAKRANDGSDPELKFKIFTTVAEAERYQDPDGFQVAWLVPVESSLLTKTFISGRNDLWAQKFEIDRVTGAVAVLQEH